MSKDDERAAIFGLALASLPPEVEEAKRARLDFEIPSLADSLRLLADLTADRARESHRVLSLLLLTKIAARRGREPFAPRGVAGALEAYSAAVVEEGRRRQRSSAAEAPADFALDAAPPSAPPAESPGDGGPEEAAGPPAIEPIPPDTPDEDVVLAALQQVAGTLEEGDAYEAFARSAQLALGLDEEEVDPPKCDDELSAKVGGVDAYQTLVTWTSARPASDYLQWTDPRLWDLHCSLFFESVEPVGDLQDSQQQFVDELFIETLRLSSSKAIVTPLLFTRRVEPDGSSSLYYKLPTNYAAVPQDRWTTAQLELDVDHGHLDAVRALTSTPQSPRTSLTAEKWIHFTDPVLADWPTLLCDLFWMEMCILMSLGCATHD